MSLITPESVWNLQQSLQAKAKANPTLRFYSLYDKIYRRECWPTPGNAAEPTAAAPEWTGRPSSKSRRKVWERGWMD